MRSSEVLLPALGLFAVLIVAVFLTWDRHAMCKSLVEGSLRRYHATDIAITTDWMDFDRDTFTYDVEYTDSSGKKQRNRCKVMSGNVLADDAVYWTDPIVPSRP